MITSKDLKALIQHPAIMQQRTLIAIIKRYDKNLNPPVSLWIQLGRIPEKWLEVLNKINEIKELDLSVETITVPFAKQLARARFNEFVQNKKLAKIDVAKALGMSGDCGQGVQRWKKTGVGKNSVVKFTEVYGKTVGHWRPDLGHLRFGK